MIKVSIIFCVWNMTMEEHRFYTADIQILSYTNEIGNIKEKPFISKNKNI